VLFGFVRNQGDGWTQALDYLTRYLDDALVSTGARPSHLPDPDVFFLALARQLGLRTAEMHRALAEQGRDDPDFAPEPISAEEVAEWRRELEGAAAEVLSKLDCERTKLPAATQKASDRGGKDIFVHASALDRAGIAGLTEGQRVAVDVIDGRKGPEAAGLRLI
jgi:maltose alpha-D-glucosyltransferase / alpha-amylase